MVFISRQLIIHIAFLLLVLTSSPALDAAISGTVIDPEGAPIEGATVRAIAPDSGLEQRLRWMSDEPEPVVLAEAETTSSGQFELDIDRSLTSIDLVVTADGRVPARLTVPHDDWIGAVVLRETDSIEGRVLSGSKPVENALVVAVSASDVELHTRTDTQGRFSLPDMGDPFGSIAVVHPDHAPFSQRFGLDDGLTVRLSQGISISGRAVSPDGETPVEGALVTIDGWPVAVSDESGAFAIEHAPADWSEARVTAGNLVTAVQRATARSTTLRLKRGNTLSGTVADAASGRAVPGVRILLTTEGPRGETIDATSTDSSGRFTFEGLLPGTYEIITRHPSWVSERDRVTIVGDRSPSKQIRIRPAATVRGSAADERGEPVAAAAIRASSERQGPRFQFFRPGAMSVDGATGRTAPDGRFVLFGVDPDAPIRLEGSHRHYPAARTDRFTVDPGETLTGRMVVFEQGSSLSGVVLTTGGDPISGAAIRATRSERGGMGRRMLMIGGPGEASEPVLTDAKGRFTLSLAEGDWDLIVNADGFAPERMNALPVGETDEPLEIVLEEGVEIQGRVVRAGVGVPDVLITVLASDRSPEPIPTGPDGSFTIEDLAAGKVNLVAIKPEELIQEMRAVEAPDRNFVIEVPEGGTIRGQVVDESTGEPVTNFQAGLNPDRTGGGMRIRIAGSLLPFHDEGGRFAIENVPPGRVELIVQAPGYLERKLGGIEVEAGKSIDDLTVDLSSGIEVTGTVRGPGGAPLAGVSVTIESDEEDPLAQMMPGLMADASTDSSGRYTIAAARPGEVTMVFRRDGYVTTRRSVELTEEKATVDATLGAGRTVSGTVTTSSGAPVPGARVRATSAGQSGGWNLAETDSAGRFSIDGLADGRYTFIASHDDYVMTELTDVDITSGQPVNLTLGEGGVITGRILGTGPETYSSITVMARSGGSFASSAVSPDGTFRIDGVAPGTASVSARMSQMFDNRTTPTTSVEVAAGSQASVDLEFAGGSSVTGRVTKFGEPLRSGIVRFAPTDRSTSGSSSNLDSDGRYAIDGLTFGTYEVTVLDLQTLSPFTRTVDIRSESETVDIDIRGGRIEGLVTDATSGQPIEGAMIILERTDGEQSGRFSRLGAQSSSAGDFVIEAVPEGSYRLRVERAGYGHATRDLFVTEGRDESVELTLQPTEGISLRVVDRRDGRPLSADIVARDAQNQLAWEGRPSPRADGTIRIPVASGTYRVTVMANGYAPSTVQLSSPGATETIALSVGGTLLIESRASERVRVRILDPYGMPAALSRWNRSGELWVDPGQNRVENLAPGQYTVQILGSDGTVSSSRPVSIREGETTTLSL